MQSIFKILITVTIVQSSISAIGTQFLTIPRNPFELINGYNPAVINEYSKTVIAFSYGNWIADMNISTIDYDRNIFNGWGGLSFRYVALNDLELRTERPTDDPLAYYNSSALAIDGRYSRKFRLGKISTAIRFISIQLYNEESNGYAIDLSWQNRIKDKINFGFAVLNIGMMSDLYEERPELPLRTVVGMTYDYTFGSSSNTISTAVEKSSLVDGIIVRMSNQSTLDNFGFQIGTEIAQEIVTVSGGLSIKLGRFQFGYAAQIGTQSLGIPQFLNLSVILP